MAQCKCNKANGERCTHKAKYPVYNPLYCGHHKNCKASSPAKTKVSPAKAKVSPSKAKSSGYEKMKVVGLNALLRKKNLSVAGKKADKISRLEKYSKNSPSARGRVEKTNSLESQALPISKQYSHSDNKIYLPCNPQVIVIPDGSPFELPPSLDIYKCPSMYEKDKYIMLPITRDYGLIVNSSRKTGIENPRAERLVKHLKLDQRIYGKAYIINRRGVMMKKDSLEELEESLKLTPRKK